MTRHHIHGSPIESEQHGGATMNSNRRRRRLAVVAIAATVALGAGVLPQFATASRYQARSLGVVTATMSSLPAAPSPSADCVSVAGCDLYATDGTVSAGATTGIPIWGFTTDPAGHNGELGGSSNNTFIISSTDTLTVNLHNDLPDGAGNLSLELPAVQGHPDLDGVPVGSTTSYSFGPLAPGTYVYEAGSTVDQGRQLAMGLAAIVVVRPADYSATAGDFNHSAYADGMGGFDDEALVVMNEIDPKFNADPLAGDVEDYAPQYFFINGKAHPDTADIGAAPSDTVLLRSANLGIRDRALGLVNSRMTLIGDDSHQFDEMHRADIESQLLTPGQAADLTTVVDGRASDGDQIALLDLDRSLVNGTESQVGGMLTFIDVIGTPAAPGSPVAKVSTLTPATNDGTTDMTIDYDIIDPAGSAVWYLDDLGGPCTGPAPAAATNSLVLHPSDFSGAGCAGAWITGQHVLWIQPSGGVPSGAPFMLALHGPTVFGLSVDPPFANLSLNKVDGTSDIVLTGSAQPSLLDYVIDDAEMCLGAPACGSPTPVDFAAPVGPSNVYALSAHIAPSLFPTAGANSIYVQVSESPTASGTARTSDWTPVSVTIDRDGPTSTVTAVSPSPAGIGNYPGNLNFLESVRVSVDLVDDLSPIADAELFLYQTDATGTGAQLRPIAGQWLDDLDTASGSHSRQAYLEVPVAELQSQDQGPISIFVHAKDAAGNWGDFTEHTLQLDKTNPLIIGNPVDVAGSHHYPTQDEDGNWVLTSGTIRVNACDPNGVDGAVGSGCPVVVTPALSTGTLPVTQLTTQPGGNEVQIRYHVDAVTGTIGTVGAGIYYQTAQQTLGTAVANGDGTYTINFDWHFVEQPPLPPEAATSVWVWVIDAAGNPSVPMSVTVGPPTSPGQVP